MKKRSLRYLVVTIALALSSVFVTTPAFAAYSPVNGDNSLNFNKFLIVDTDANIPAITFTYSIAPGTAVAADGSKPAILAGVGTPTVGTASFTNGENADSAKQGTDDVTLNTGEKYAKKVVNVNFTGVSFDQPGIYRYVITENTNADNKAVSYDTQTNGISKTRYLDVYVEDDAGSLKVSQYVLHETADVVDGAATEASDKSTGFVNKITSHSFTFGKEVTGNQGSKEKYFKFTLTINNAQASTTYTVDLRGADTDPTKTDATVYDSMTNPATITTGSHGVVTEYFYLKDGQYITIKGLPEGFMYELSEIAEDYTASNGITSGNSSRGVAHGDPVANTTTGANADIKTGFTNDRSGTVPTGVIVTVAPFVIGILLFGAAIIYILNKRRRELYL